MEFSILKSVGTFMCIEEETVLEIRIRLWTMDQWLKYILNIYLFHFMKKYEFIF